MNTVIDEIVKKVFFNAETAKIAETIVLKYNKLSQRGFAVSASFVAKPGF